ncbi:MAG: acetylglutamate kinase [Sphingomonadales bacterium]|jgi:acetylglutamate kinase
MAADISPDHPLAQIVDKAATLAEAMPFLKKYAGRTFVIKYGGHAMGDEAAAESFARDVVILKQIGINPVIVHGGGPQIGKMLERLRIQSSFIDGLRVTDAATVEIAEMVLSGSINKQVVANIGHAGGVAVGISGRDGGLVTAEPIKRTKKDPDSHIEQVLDLGFVGEPKTVNPHILEVMQASDIIPVIAPLANGEDGATYNINADTMAGAIAGALNAARFILLTDVAGVLDKDKNLLTDLNKDRIAALKEDGTITGGMIPKVDTCLNAVDAGVEAAVILDGRMPHALLLEIFTTKGAGTLVRSAN